MPVSSIFSKTTCKTIAMIEFEFADLHCHPTLKAYGRSFDKSKRDPKKSGIWYQKKPSYLTLLLQRLLGITRFSQADLSSMARSRVRIAFVSLYPFEKSFFFTRWLPDPVSARLASWVTSIGYRRVSHLQRHQNYFEDLMGELRFLEQSPRRRLVNGTSCSWDFLKNPSALTGNLKQPGHVHVVPTIEGAHILNTGLGAFGRPTSREEVFENIRQLKLLPHPPVFITLAHNFNNELCGHAPSLQGLGAILDQSENLGCGFSSLGWEVVEQLLDPCEGAPIYIDLKHMSLTARKEFYPWHKSKWVGIPFVVSHGALTGCRMSDSFNADKSSPDFAADEINFFDEELVELARSQGVFGLQLDAKRLAPKRKIRKSILPGPREKRIRRAAGIVWDQIRHAAEVLDAHGLPAWDTLCIGSDFDGTINPLDGIWSARELNLMANALLEFASAYLEESPPLKINSNRQITAESIVRKFTLENARSFLDRYWITGS